jgi:SAM-dependent methyltransferase
MMDEQRATATRWQLAARAPEVYAEHLVPAIFAPWAPVLLDAARVGPGDVVLDVACGTGVVAAAAAERVGSAGRVTGVDVNPGMLAVAAALTERVRWVQADAARLPFPDGGVDRVLCQAGLPFVPDRLGAVREMRRTLRPGGRLALLVWRALHHSPGFAALADALQAVVGPEAAAVMRAPFVFDDDPRPLAALLGSAGFGEVDVQARAGVVRFGSVEAFVRCQRAGSPLAAHVQPRYEAELVARVADGLGVRPHDPAVFPIEAAVATGLAEAGE